MRKITLLLVVLLAYSSSWAQDEGGYKPSGGEWNAEVNFDPFSSSPININYLRFRKFTSATSAIRLGVSISGRSEKPDTDLTNSTFTINLKPGYEIHFAGTNRISPYVGGELDFAMKSSRVKDDANDSKLKDAWDQNGQQRGYTRVGLNAVLGVDFYVVKHLYLGTEIGYGFEATNAADIEVDPDPTNSNPISEGGSTFEFGPNFNSSLRLGFIF